MGRYTLRSMPFGITATVQCPRIGLRRAQSASQRLGATTRIARGPQIDLLAAQLRDDKSRSRVEPSAGQAPQACM